MVANAVFVAEKEVFGCVGVLVGVVRAGRNPGPLSCPNVFPAN
jgi:hypothetical protein